MSQVSDTRESYFADLMRRSLDGDQRSYRELLKSIRVIMMVYAQGFLLRMGKQDKATIDDVVQEILLAIHQKRHTYDQNLAFLSWIFVIAKYKLIDFGRSERRRNTKLQAADMESIASPDQHIRTDIKNDLAKLLAELSEPARQALQLVKLDGLSVEEAADALSMSPSAIKVSIHRSLKKLSNIGPDGKSE